MSQVKAKMEQNSAEMSKNNTKYRQNCPKNQFLEGWKFYANSGLQKKSKKSEKWGTSPSNGPAMLRAGAMGKGREGDKSPSQGLGRKGFINLSG